MGKEFNPHEIEWTSEKISRFWDHYASKEAHEQNFFSWMVGDAIINLAEKHSSLKGNILDYGCGHGFLIEKLIKRGIPCEGIEFSPDSVKKVIQKFQNEKKFIGVTLAQHLPTPVEPDKYDFIFVIETIEHLIPKWLDQTINELYRIIKKGGFIIVTVPNEENLDAGKVLCPECGGIFHIIQHMTSWNNQTLVSRMKSAGFQKVLCKITLLREEGRLSYFKHIFMLLAHKFTGKKLPHLIYIGRKPL